MLKLFQSIFGNDTGQGAPFSEDLIARATGRALDGTDPRLRLVTGCQRRLRPAVIHAIDHVVHLVDGLGAPVELTRRNYGVEARLTALFVSVDHLLDVLTQDPALSQFRRGSDASGAERAYALMTVQKHEKKVLGIDLHGDVVQREVAQVAVNFTDHRLLDPAADAGEMRRLLMRRAFDHLLTLALGRITEEQRRRETLKRQRGLLQRKLELLKTGKWGFDAGVSDQPDAEAIEGRLAEIETQLESLPPDPKVFAANLDIVAHVLMTAESQLWAKRASVVVDRMGIARERATGVDLAFELGELHSADGRTLFTLPVCIVMRELPPPVDTYRQAQRYLGG